MGKIFVESNDGRFANQLFPLFYALTLFENNRDKYDKILFKNYIYNRDYRISLDVLKKLPKELTNYISFDKREYDIEFDKYEVGKDFYIDGYCQDLSLIDFDVIRKYFYCPDNIKEIIHSLYGDISDKICIHVRRGDYLSEDFKDRFISPSIEYITHSMNEFFEGEKFICISDDIQWCKENIKGDIIFADKSDDFLIDFYIQTITKGNICSASSFSIAGVILNPYRKCVIPNKLMKTSEGDKFNMFPQWAIKQEIL